MCEGVRVLVSRGPCGVMVLAALIKPVTSRTGKSTALYLSGFKISSTNQNSFSRQVGCASPLLFDAPFRAVYDGRTCTYLTDELVLVLSPRID